MTLDEAIKTYTSNMVKSVSGAETIIEAESEEEE